MYIDETSFYATVQSEPLPVVMNIHSARRAGRRRRKACRFLLGYGLELGHSVRTVGGAGALRDAFI